MGGLAEGYGDGGSGVGRCRDVVDLQCYQRHMSSMTSFMLAELGFHMGRGHGYELLTQQILHNWTPAPQLTEGDCFCFHTVIMIVRACRIFPTEGVTTLESNIVGNPHWQPT